MRVLSITHGPTVPGGVFDALAEEEGHRLEAWSAPIGGSPGPPEAFDAVMVFGGAMHPDQDAEHGWLEREAAFLRGALEREIPIVGVCLGAQMLARAAGAWVGPASSPEIGWHEVELTEEGRADPVLGTLSARTDAFQWHEYTFGIPDGGVELARSPVCTQAFRVGPSAWALQFHAEVTLPMVEAWVKEDPGALPVPGAEFLAETGGRIDRWNVQGRKLCAAFLEVAERRAAGGRAQVEGATSSTTSTAADA